jgi:hypothetical protein
VVADQAVPRESTPPTTPGSQAVAAPAAAKELVVDDTQETALPNGKRKRLRQHIVVTGAAAPAPGATKRQKKPTSKPQKKQVEKKATVKKPAAKMASLTALMAAMGEAPSASAVVHKVLDKSPSLDDVLESYVETLNDASANIDSRRSETTETTPITWRMVSRIMSSGKKMSMAQGEKRCKRLKRGVQRGGGQGEGEGGEDREL